MFNEIPSLDEEVEVVPIGNHCRGTTFLNGNHLITDNMVQAIDSAAKEYPGFHYGRFDLRCKSIEELERGNFTILELNGCGAEPAHIYHPGYPLFKAYRELARHLKIMFQIARQNHANGTPYMTIGEAIKLVRFLRHYNQNGN